MCSRDGLLETGQRRWNSDRTRVAGASQDVRQAAPVDRVEAFAHGLLKVLDAFSIVEKVGDTARYTPVRLVIIR